MLDVQNVAILNRYATGVLERIGHHAQDVSFAFHAVLGHVVTHAKQMDLFGDGTKNAAWFISKKTGKRYALSYGHPSIILREDSFRGPVVATFNNDTHPKYYERIFNLL